MNHIFIDTGPFQALNNEEDQYFSQTEQRMRSIEGKGMVLITSDYVIDEVYTALLIRAGYKNAMHFDQYLRRGGWEIIFISQHYFSLAQSIFRRYNKDKRWSFTDCTRRHCATTTICTRDSASSTTRNGRRAWIPKKSP